MMLIEYATMLAVVVIRMIDEAECDEIVQQPIDLEATSMLPQ
jgi:hypothetical protein